MLLVGSFLVVVLVMLFGSGWFRSGMTPRAFFSVVLCVFCVSEIPPFVLFYSVVILLPFPLFYRDCVAAALGWWLTA